MQQHKSSRIFDTPQTESFTLVYFYLIAGISLMISVFLFAGTS